MPKLKLTKTSIDQKRKPGAGTVIYFDTETKGFGLRVTASGAASFIVQGTVAGQAKEARITIGSYGAWTLEQARRRAEEYKHQFEDGIDPREVKKAALADKADDEAKLTTLQDVLDAYVGRPDKLKESSAAEMRRHVEKVFTAWKDKPIASITRDMVKVRHRELVENGLEGKRGAPASANAAFVTLRILINFAQRQYLLADGETPIIRVNPVTVLADHWAEVGDRSDRYIEKQHAGTVWNALQKARLNPKNRDALAGIDLTIFALLTGGRKMEIAALTWDRVKIEGDDPASWSWHLPNPKNGKPIWLPLSTYVVELLRDRRKKTNSPFVFPSWSKAGHIMDARATMEMVSVLVGKHLSLHDMRRTFTNIALRECLIEKFRVDYLTNHEPAQSDTTARNYFDPKRLGWLQPEVQKIGDWLAEQGTIAEAKAKEAAKQAA